MSNKKSFLIIENVEILDIAAEGNAIAKIENKVLFIPQAIPGDIVNVRITRKRSGYMEGVISEIVSPSPIRVNPKCSHFGTCGGCKWQHLPYSEQLKYKQKQVFDAIERIGKVKSRESLPIVGSDNQYFYRNKLEYTFSATRWLTAEEISSTDSFDKRGFGFHMPGMFDKVLKIDFCHLQPEPSNEIRNAVRDFAFNNDCSFYNFRSHEGFLRTFMIRNNIKGDVMVVAVFGNNDSEKIEMLMKYLKEKFPQIKSLNYVINTKHNDTFNDLEVINYSGLPYIIETMENLNFRIGPKSFFQTNSHQAYKLYSITRDFANLKGTEVVYDLYTGTGTIALFVAAKAKKVVGVEYIEEAVIDARINAEDNKISNTVFYSGDMKDVLNSQFIIDNGQPDVMIIDPPRAGMHPDVVKTVIETAPERIVYVSCNPATQARDINMMSEFYTLDKIQAVDMFPNTHHVESVALLLRKEKVV